MRIKGTYEGFEHIFMGRRVFKKLKSLVEKL
jgi:hypothetical protein